MTRDQFAAMYVKGYEYDAVRREFVPKVSVVRKYGDPQTCALIEKLGGPKIHSVSNRFSLVLGLEIGVPERARPTARSA